MFKSLFLSSFIFLATPFLESVQNEKLVDIAIEDVLELESRLSESVLAQPEATQAISRAMINYCAGLNNPLSPVAVFLFLGPTGVGKTELAKVLTETLYKSKKYLIRYDMSHFSEPHSLARLIGSPPGYANHDEGGRFTSALKLRPQCIVLLDEIEKAHPTVRKVFLPVFDEGYIKDAKDKIVYCREAIFIMTSNLCSQKITSFFHEGYSDQEILRAIEPDLIQALTPELYNRIQPVIFRPLERQTMYALVELMLDEVVNRLKYSKNICLVVEESAKAYLVNHGFHPLLGARALKKCIENTLIASLSYAIVKKDISEGCTAVISHENDSWLVKMVSSDDR